MEIGPNRIQYNIIEADTSINKQTKYTSYKLKEIQLRFPVLTKGNTLMFFLNIFLTPNKGSKYLEC